MGDKWFIGLLAVVYGVGFALASVAVAPIIGILAWLVYEILTM